MAIAETNTYSEVFLKLARQPCKQLTGVCDGLHLVERRVREELQRRALFLAAPGENVGRAPRQERLQEQGDLEGKNDGEEWRGGVRKKVPMYVHVKYSWCREKASVEG